MLGKGKVKITIFTDEINLNSIINVLKKKELKNVSYKVEKPLTKRELDILKLIVEGKTNFQIGEILAISPHTVKAHLCSIFEKFRVNDRLLAAIKAVRENLV